MRWPRGKDGRPNPLRVGQEVTETTKVLSAEAKVVKKTGEDMIVVGVEKEFRNEEGVAVVDRRCVLRSNPYPYTHACRDKNGLSIGWLANCLIGIGSSARP